MIRVAMIAHLSELSGAGTALVEKADHLDKSRFETTLILPGYGPLYDFAKKRKINVHVIETPEVSLKEDTLFSKCCLVRQRISYVFAVKKYLNVNHFSVAFINSTASIFSGLATLLAKLPIVWMVHEVLENPARSTRLKMSFIRKCSKAMVWDSNLGKRLFPPRSNMPSLVLPNYVDTTRFRHVPHVMNPDTVRTIVCNGPFPRKGADIFVKAAKLVAESTAVPCKFILVGPEMPAYADFCAALRSEGNVPVLRDKFEFAGVLNDMPKLLGQTDIFVSASRNEAWPIIVLEAMSSGCAVICTDVGDCSLIVGAKNERGLLIPTENPQLLANAIIHCINYENEARHRAKNAYTWVSKTCSGKAYWEPLEQLLVDVATR